MSSSFTQVFGGTTIYPSDVSYLALALTADITLEWPVGAGEGDSVVARIIDITPTGTFTVTLPDATAVSVGQTILFNNLGPSTITVDNAAGNAILSIGAGEQWQCYLISNTTIGGVWRTFRYGAAVAQAQAAALAGAGLTATGSTLAQNYDVTSFSSTPYSLTAPDRAKVFVWTGGLGTLNFPTAVAAGDGWFVQIRNAGQGDLTLDPSGTELINASSTLLLQPGDSAVIVSDGIQWYTIGLGQQAVFAFDYTTIAVTGGTYTLSGSELNRIAYKFTGTLTSNVNIVVPSTVQQYWVNNGTTGAFTLGVKTSAGSATLVTQGETAILYCDGTNIISATTSSVFAGTVPVAQGGTGAVTAPSALTNLGGTGIGTSVFTAATTAAARSAIAAAASGANSDITSITGLTTPLTVAQGGTGANNATTARSNLSAAASGSNADITALTNAAGIQIGAPTAGAQGAGTINATGLFINGVGVGTGSGSVTSVAATVPSFLSIAGSPITTSGTLAFSLSGTALPVANGGTGQTTYTDGQLLIGNSTGNTLAKTTLTAGSGISITNGAGAITITSTAGGGTVTSVDASGGTTGLSFTGGPVTTTGTLTVAGTLAIASGGTGATSASGARLTLLAAGSGANSDITSLTGLTTALSVGQGGTGVATTPTNGQLLIGNGTNYSVAAITAGSGVSVTNSAGGITIAATGSGGTVTSVSGSGGTTGLTLAGGPITGTGTLTIAGTLAVANGGTGAITAGAALTSLGAYADTNPSGFTSNTGTVTSVGGTGTVNGLTLTGTVTSTGDLTLGGTLSGVSLSTQVTGTLPVANGGTGQTTYTDGQLLIGNSTGNTLAKTTLTAGTNVTITNGAGAITINAADQYVGTVTSVGGTGTVNGLTLTGTVTSTGDLTLGGTLSGVSLTTQVSGTLPIANGGTNATTAAAALTSLGAYPAANPSGYTSNTGTVTSVGGTGTVNGLTLTGTVTSTGNLTLGGTLSGVSLSTQVTGTLPVANGGTGGTTQATARSGIAAAASGANTDITALDQDVTVTATGTISASTIGYRGIPQNAQTGAYTLVLADAGKHISNTTGGFAIPANGTTAFPIGTTIMLFNNSSSSQNITITTDTLRFAGTATTGTLALAQYGLATCVKVGTTTWVASGAGLS